MWLRIGMVSVSQGALSQLGQNKFYRVAPCTALHTIPIKSVNYVNSVSSSHFWSQRRDVTRCSKFLSMKMKECLKIKTKNVRRLPTHRDQVSLIETPA